MPSNRAAWLIAKSAVPLEVKPAPYTPPGRDEIVVQNGAVAINPVDWLKVKLDNLLFPWVKYPFILGQDVAGEVCEVGKDVTRFKVGDRVLGHAVGMDKRSNKSSECAFQEYTVLRTNLASPIPDSMPYEDACVIPLCASTAACALFMKDFLALKYPTVPAKSNGETLLVWGGSTSLGCNAIQQGVAAGYEVIATSSPRNFDLLRRLGASQVFDYNSKATVSEITKALSQKHSAGAIAVGLGSLEACIDIIGASKGNKFVAQASAPLPDIPANPLGFVPILFGMVWWFASMWYRGKTKGVRSKFLSGSDLMANEVGSVLYEDFLPTALAEGKYIAAPEPQVVGKGLEYIQEAMDINKAGVSAKKVVVSL